MSRPAVFKALVIAMLALLLAACASNRIPGPNNRMIAAHHDAAKYLIRMAGPELQPNSRMIAASFADVNNLTMSSTFGRMASQNLVSSFVIEGYSFVEMLMRSSVYIDERQGEFLLSREVADISAQHNAPVVLVGTYAVADDNVFVTAKLIRTADNVIVASYDYAVPYTRDMRTLVRPQR
ncbi:MAG: FlgO family outer membrane protein [Pseudohongiella sp.]|nr:FlgO family outer membrane protein [Pseudohongiella sp.]MDO9519239.1 FlgO family outer membrane protein [Pseudohongiella sp.]MDP2128350.1 FlgO family outer membrane protein [Pseudohongiella sp.]